MPTSISEDTLGTFGVPIIAVLVPNVCTCTPTVETQEPLKTPEDDESKVYDILPWLTYTRNFAIEGELNHQNRRLSKVEWFELKVSRPSQTSPPNISLEWEVSSYVDPT